MWPAAIISLLMGMILGYLYAKSFQKKASPLLEELEDLSAQLVQLQEQEKLLKQDNADLKYKLGEEQKARSYYQNKNH